MYQYIVFLTECKLSSVLMVVFRYNLLFFVSGGGKFNYQGTKRWLEDNLDHTGAASSAKLFSLRDFIPRSFEASLKSERK